MSVQSQTTQPICPNNTLIFNCQLNFPAFSIQWKHITLGDLEFFDIDHSVGDIVKTANGRVVANLTRKGAVQNTSRVLFSSTLTIYPPLNNVSNTNLDNTNITCEGTVSSGLRSDDAPISLYGEKLRICLIMHG